MTNRVNNYDIQLAQAKKRFLTYDQQELIRRCGLKYDETFFYPFYRAGLPDLPQKR